MVAAMIAPLLVLLAAAQAAAAPAPSDPIAADWKPIPDDELMVKTLGDGHRVVIRLASAYAPEHVANLKRLAKTRWWDGESVYRVPENWVAPLGDPTEKTPPPAAYLAVPADQY